MEIPPMMLEGNTLGEKQKHFNKLVQDAISSKQFILTPINYNDDDIDNLLKIDIASKTRNVDYIIHVLKCEDMLYISRAIKQSTWLITDEEYAHIINPEYLHLQLFPYMLTKAINKLLLHIRLNLKKNHRVEEFYDYLKDRSNEAHMWLLNCSTSFIENTVLEEQQIPLKVYKRLCKRSVIFLQYYNKVEAKDRKESVKAVSFLMKSNSKEYLKVISIAKKNYHVPSLGKKATKRIMKTSASVILDNFPDFIKIINVPALSQCIRKEEIKQFLYKYLKNENTSSFLRNYNNLKYFVKHLPDEEKYDFVKKTFIDNNVIELSTCLFSTRSVTTCLLYQYAPFPIVFTELKKLIHIENSPAKRYVLFSVLITCAKNNPQYTKSLLQFYHDEHESEPYAFKIKFINKIIKQMATHQFDSETWHILNKLFTTLEVYTESGRNLQLCLKCIILYKILHDEHIPDLIDTTLYLDTFKEFHSKLNEEQRNKVFLSLFHSKYKKLQDFSIATETDLNQAFDLLENILNLLNDWDMDLKKYLIVIDKMNELLKIKEQRLWSSKDLSVLYNMNKSWRRHMFKKSTILFPTEEVCLNALKHEPQLLAHYSCELEALRTDNTVQLRRLLSKLRVYWPHTLAQQWTNAYINNKSKIPVHKSVFRGLFALLSRQQVLDIAKKYVPEDTNTDLSKLNQIEVSIRKNIVKNLHIARLLTSLDVVLWYAKEDYLDHTQASLKAILYNISEVHGRDCLSKLLKAPEQLQKHGIELAFMKLKYVELKPLFLNIWESTQYLYLRRYLFSYTYSLLCKAKVAHVARELWEMLKMFIDHLPTDEDKVIFKKLCTLKQVPVHVQGVFYKKSYDFITALPAKSNFKRYYNILIKYAPKIMHLLDTEFVANKILASIKDKISRYPCKYINIITAYVLYGGTEEEQCERFKRVLDPALKHAFKSWNLVINGKLVMRSNVDTLLTRLVKDFCKLLLLKKIIVPVKLFTSIKTVMEENICILTNYTLYTAWKLTTEIIKLVPDYQNILCNSKLDRLAESDFVNEWSDDAVKLWDTMMEKMAPTLGQIFVKHLKNDTEKYFPSITWLFRDAFNKTFLEHFQFEGVQVELEIMKYMIMVDYDFVPSYLVVCHVIHKYGGPHIENELLELRKMLLAHLSQEVKFHYGAAFGAIPA